MVPGDEDAAERRSGHGGGLESAGVPSDGVGEDVGGQQRRDQGRARRPADGLPNGGHEKDGINRPKRPGEKRKDSQAGGAGRGEQLHRHHDASAVESVGDMAGGEGQENDGRGGHKADPAEGHGVLGALIQIPGDGHFENLASDHRDDPADKIKPEIAESQGGIRVMRLVGQGRWFAGIGHNGMGNGCDWSEFGKREERVSLRDSKPFIFSLDVFPYRNIISAWLGQRQPPTFSTPSPNPAGGRLWICSPWGPSAM